MSRKRNIASPKTPVENVEYTLIIPAAGTGTRMKSYGSKSLIHLPNNKTLIEHQISVVRAQFNVTQTIVVVGFEGDKVANRCPPGVTKVENERYGETNVTRSIGIGLLAALNPNVIIVYGNSVFCKEAFLGLNPVVESTTILSSSKNINENKLGSTFGLHLEKLFYDLEHEWSQILILKDRELKLMREFCMNKQNEKLFGFEIINEIINRGGKIKAHLTSSKFCSINTTKDLNKIGYIV